MCFKGWAHDEIDAGNIAEVEWKSTPEMLQAMLHAMLHRVATPQTDMDTCGNMTINDDVPLQPDYTPSADLSIKTKGMGGLYFLHIVLLLL